MEELLRFFDDINIIHDNIKFDCKYSKESINFLDTTYSKTNEVRYQPSYSPSQLTDQDIFTANHTTQSRKSGIYHMDKHYEQSESTQQKKIYAKHEITSR